jgi:nucleoside-diphosphate-sugar epimerase
MKILVTGAAGFIGSKVAVELSKRGHQVTAADMFLDRLYPNQQKIHNWDNLSTISGIKRVVIDLRGDLSSLNKDFDAVVNEAGMPGLMASWNEFETYLSCNVQLVGNLMSHFSGTKTHFVQISTSSVYGQEATGPETSELKPYSPYGLSKLAAEELVKTYHQAWGQNFTILRYFSVFGPGQRPDMAYHKIIKAITESKQLTIYGDGKQSRTNTYVEDVAFITSLVAENKPTNDVFNISGVEPIELLGAVTAIEKLLGKKAIIKFGEPRPGDQRSTHGDISKAKEKLGYHPKVGFLEGIERQIEWQINLG